MTDSAVLILSFASFALLLVAWVALPAASE